MNDPAQRFGENPIIAPMQLLSIRVAAQISWKLDAASNTSPSASLTGNAIEA